MKRAIILATCLLYTAAVAGSYDGNSKTVTHDCAKDPDPIVNGNKNTITFTGECATIGVQGNGNTLTISAVKSLSVPGNKNTIAVDGADSIRVDGNDNTLTWKKPIKGKAVDVTTRGTNNKISQKK